MPENCEMFHLNYDNMWEIDFEPYLLDEEGPQEVMVCRWLQTEEPLEGFKSYV